MTRPAAEIRVSPGPMLLSEIDLGPGYVAHVSRFGSLPRLDVDDILALASAAGVRGRGGAGFPFATKLETAAKGRRPVVVVNVAEGEIASAKDSALVRVAPHRVLDGAVLAARALGARTIHIVTGSDRPETGRAVDAAIAERRGERVRWAHHTADPRFVAGQARAVIELMSGRAGLPVTAWTPEAISGYKGRPTLLSNAETFAHVFALARFGAAGYAAHGTPEEPGTTLLTVASMLPTGPVGQASPHVIEVAHGAPFASVLTDEQLSAPVLLGGFHGTWAAPGALRTERVSAIHLRSKGIALGAGVLLPLADGSCPVARTGEITSYLANESARRCGPCMFGLPALAEEVHGLVNGADTRRRVEQLLATVERRGACAHPDGTARLVRSLLTGLPDVVENHLAGRCSCRSTQHGSVA